MNGLSSVLFSGLSTARVAFAPDLDETFHQWKNSDRKSGKIANPWGLRAQNRFLAAHQDDVAVVFNTANSLRDMKKRIKYLQGAPLDGLILGNGRQVFVNYDEKSAEQWLGDLKETDAEPEWDSLVINSSNWDMKGAKTIIRQTLLAEGYHGDPDDLNGEMSGTLPDGTPIHFEFVPNHSAFDLITETNDPATLQKGEAETSRLAEKIRVNAQRVCNMIVEPMGFDMPQGEGHLFVRNMMPGGINKGIALQYFLKKMPKLQAVVTAGDNELNDLPSLTPYNYLNRQGDLVPNLPIVMPERPKFTEAMADHPNAVTGTPGSINPALKKQLKKLDILS